MLTSAQQMAMINTYFATGSDAPLLSASLIRSFPVAMAPVPGVAKLLESAKAEAEAAAAAVAGGGAGAAGAGTLDVKEVSSGAGAAAASGGPAAPQDSSLGVCQSARPVFFALAGLKASGLRKWTSMAAQCLEALENTIELLEVKLKLKMNLELKLKNKSTGL